MDDWKQRLWTDPNRRGGKPCVRGTRIAVVDVLEYLAGGMSVAEVLHDFPDLTEADVLACFAHAAELERAAAGGAA